MSNALTEQIRAKARELLSEGRVQCVVGYEQGSDGLRARPAFVYAPQEVDRLLFDQTCTHNLAKYLLDKKGRPSAVVAKPCDLRSLNVLLSEQQLRREEVFILGVACEGIREVRTFGQVGEAFQTRCQDCTQRVPTTYDFLAGEAPSEGADARGATGSLAASNRQAPAKASASSPGSPEVEASAGRIPATPVGGASRQAQIARLCALSPAQRASFWAEQFSRCLRCYACRQVCPGCYCAECFVEQLDPNWVGIRIGPAENQIFQTIRAFHLAGRCVGCDECERVCPVHIPLGLLSHKLDQEVEEMFGHHAGERAEGVAPLFTFQPDERLGMD